MNRIPLAASAVFISIGSAFAYGPTGHEIVGGIADKLVANTPAAQKIYALTDGITLERASTIADEIKAWDKNGVDDLNAFPRYREHSKIDNQLREFWRANPPTQGPEIADAVTSLVSLHRRAGFESREIFRWQDRAHAMGHRPHDFFLRRCFARRHAGK